MASIEDAPERMLRAWADAGIISSARYVEEMARRHPTCETRILAFPNGETMTLFEPDRMHVAAPPLDYAIEHELAADLDIPDLDRIEAMFDDDDRPNPAPGAWIVGFFLATVAIAGVLIWRSL
jgi:hypothetical protein